MVKKTNRSVMPSSNSTKPDTAEKNSGNMETFTQMRLFPVSEEQIFSSAFRARMRPTLKIK